MGLLGLGLLEWCGGVEAPTGEDWSLLAGAGGAVPGAGQFSGFAL